MKKKKQAGKQVIPIENTELINILKTTKNKNIEYFAEKISRTLLHKFVKTVECK